MSPTSNSQTRDNPLPANESASKAGRRPPLLKVIVGVIAAVALFALARQLGGSLPQVADWIDGLGPRGPLAFILIYAVAVVAFVPGSILTLAGGALFGIGWGTLYVFAAAVIGSGAAFLVSRYVARGLVESRLADHPKFESIDHAVADQGLKIVFLLRLSPAFPFSFMNYALGLTRVSFRDFMSASVGMLPGSLLYVYYGKAAGDVATLASGAAVERGVEYYAVLTLGLAATIAVTTVVTRLARHALAESAESAK
jgi:uncharacterized membrane protein YdjX (TVP38/TMEM64 family)